MSRTRSASLALLAALAAAGCGDHPVERPAEMLPPLAASVGRAEASALVPVLEVPASVLPVRRARPGTVLMGRVSSIDKREGERVRAGDVLARVASEEVVARRAQTEAALTAARAMEDSALRTRERLERLFARDAASRKNLEDAVAGHDAARAQRQAAEEAVRAASVHVDHATVRAPFDGIVTRRLVERGDLAAPGMPLFEIEDLSRLKIEAEVGESDAVGLSAGTPVEVVPEAAARATRTATLHEVLPTADARSRTVTVRVLLDDPDGALRSGTFARLRLPRAAATGPPAVLVPETAVMRRGPLTGVFVVGDGDVARLRWVTLGDGRDGRVVVLTGLAAGERIVTAPPPELEDGRRVAAAPEGTVP